MDPVILIGKRVPGFSLPDLEEKSHDLSDVQGWIRVLNFWSAECDWCERVDRELTAIQDQWKDKIIVWWIASNAHEPRAQMEKAKRERGLSTVLLDDHQQVADLYGAQTTPHFFVVDGAGRLAYQGAWDDITFRQRQASKQYVTEAIEALINGKAPEITQTLPYGCVLLRTYAEER